MQIIKFIGIAGFVICLYIMYATNHGVKGLRSYDPNFKLLDMRFHYNAADVTETFTKLGERGRTAYQNFWVLDFFFITCFIVVQIAIVNSIDMINPIRNGLLILSILRAVFDIAENSMLIYLIKKYPTQNNQLVTMCSWVTTSKFVVLDFWYLGVGGVLLYLLIKKIV